MKNKWLSVVLIPVLFICFGCGNKRINTVPEDLSQKLKEDFLLNYGFYATNNEKKELKKIQTINEVEIFIHRFWWGDSNGHPSRDPDPGTPEHELKDVIDRRIADIKNEIFALDIDTPGARFDSAGGLRGDMAHVYLFYGMPQYKAKLSAGRSHVELMAWYYIDVQGKPLFRFLFYDNYGVTRLFKNYAPIFDMADLIDPLSSPFAHISNRSGPSPEDLYDTWSEVKNDDIWIRFPDGNIEPIFMSALINFSYYKDIYIDNSLKAPEPAALIAARFKPAVLGQPEDLTGREFIMNSYYSFIPAELRITKDGRPLFSLVMGYSAVDWEIKGDNGEAILGLRISFQHKDKKDIREFKVNIHIVRPLKEIEAKRGLVNMLINLDDLRNFSLTEKAESTLHHLIDELEPGTYIINVGLWHTVTKKRAGGWQEEILII